MATNRGHYDVPASQRGFEKAAFVTKLEAPTSHPAKRVFEIAPVYKEESVLDIPSGDGAFAFQYATAARAVVALDWRDAMIKISLAEQERRGLQNVHFRRTDPRNLGTLPASSFDLVVCHQLRQFRDAAPILEQAKRLAKRAVVWAEPVGPADKNSRNFLDTLLEMRNGFRCRSLSEAMCVDVACQDGWILQERKAIRHLQNFDRWAAHLDRDERQGLYDDLTDDMEDNDADLFPHIAGRRLHFLERWLVLLLVRKS